MWRAHRRFRAAANKSASTPHQLAFAVAFLPALLAAMPLTPKPGRPEYNQVVAVIRLVRPDADLWHNMSGHVAIDVSKYSIFRIRLKFGILASR
jgi:hypothetical protein